ncbi:AIM24 family protein [Planctomonas psychrotolerans]|uniref:AIM24 family protein n=1 Tax=Planctomonas psychrotolerans TaxID=2528712 RepID=UPI00123B854B|nr:AIM24 family protein [Planctomonas psychrotolerans]
MRSALFSEQNQEKQTSERWALQSTRMLRTVLGEDVIATKGAMVAFQGQVAFHHEGAGSIGKLMKKMLTSEDAPMMRVSGTGEVFFARQANNIFLLQLEGDAISVSSKNLLAMDASISWDIRRVQGAGMVSGGLFNLLLEGQGMAAICCEGEPLILDCSVQPTFVDAQAVVCWSGNLTPQVHNSMNMRSMLRGGSGEAFQLAFHGPGFVVVQPSEGIPVPRPTGS